MVQHVKQIFKLAALNIIDNVSLMPMLKKFLLKHYLRSTDSSFPRLSPEHLFRLQQHIQRGEGLVRIGLVISLFLFYFLGPLSKRLPLVADALRGLDAIIVMNSLERNDSVQPRSVNSNSFHSEKWDLIVIGSGPGGSIAALNGVKSGMKTLLLEKGCEPTRVEHHSVNQIIEMFDFAGQQVILGSRPIGIAQGRTLGGGSEVNSGLFHRIPHQVIEHWAKACGLEINDLLYCQSEVERRLQIETQLPKTLGVYSNSPIRSFAHNAGWEYGLIPRWRKYLTDSEFTHFGMSLTYLKEAKQHGLKVATGTYVRKVLPKRDHVEVVAHSNSEQAKIQASKVVISAGAIETPRILMRSHLARGSDFQIGFHAMTRVVAQFDEEVNDLTDIDPYQAWTDDLKYKFGAGVATNALLASTLVLQGLAFSQIDSPRKVGVYYASSAPTGYSRFVTIGKSQYPFFLFDTTSKQVVKDGDELLRQAIKSVAGSRILSPDTKKPSVSSVHIFGSMPIGNSKLVDNRGRLRAFEEQIQILDLSLLPSAPRVNPQGPAMTLLSAIAGSRS